MANRADLDLDTMPRSQLQREIQFWCLEAFGHAHTFGKVARALRFLEESIELFQACGGDMDQAIELIRFIKLRPAGAPGQEIGGVMVTLYALAEALSIDVELAELHELYRIFAKPIAEFTKRNEEKNEAGFAVKED